MNNQEEERLEPFGSSQIAAVAALLVEQQKGNRALEDNPIKPPDVAEADSIKDYRPDGDE
jgi:hypothetical protein